MSQNLLIADNNNIFFRNKILSKFTPKVNEVKTNKRKSSKNVDKPTTFNKLSSSIPAKLLKEVNKILKFFKNMQTNRKKD